MIDENAQIVDGDAILAICAKDMLQKGMLSSPRVVGTQMTNSGYKQALKELGIDVIVSQVGDRNVLHEMVKSETNLGGESSGHVIFLDHNTTGDGLVSALQVLRIMIETGSKLSELAGAFKKYPQVLLNVPVSSKPPIEEMEGLVSACEEIERGLGSSGRVLLRYSGTESILRIMVEGPKKSEILILAQQLERLVQEQIGK